MFLRRHKEDAALFALVSVWNGALVWLVALRLNIYIGDAIARTYLAWKVFFGADPKLANVGFVWTPLMTLLQLPLVLVAPASARGLAGNLITVLTGAGCAVMLNRLARRAGWARPLRWLLVLAFILNPMTMYFAANGMSEMLFAFLVLAAASFYIEWCETRRWVNVVGMSGAAAFAFLARYDGLLVIGVLAGLLLLHHRIGWRGRRAEAEGTLLAYLAPPVYVVFLWIAMNWLIMGDPLYFMRSSYSQAGQIGYVLAANRWLRDLHGNAVGTVVAVLGRVAGLAPALIPLTLIALVVAVRRRTLAPAGLVALAWVTPALTAAQVFSGSTAFYLRYLLLVLPMSFVLAIWLTGRMARFRVPAQSLAVIMLLLTCGATGYTMNTATEIDPQSTWFINGLLHRTRNDWWAADADIARYISENVQGRSVLVDDFEGHAVVYFSGRPERFLTTGDRGFRQALGQPYGSVGYVLVSRAELAGTLNQVNLAYPSLYDNGADWAHLERASGPWRLYRVTGPTDRAATRE